MSKSGFGEETKPLSPTRHYFETVLSTLTLLLVMFALATSIASAISIMGVDLDMSDDDSKSIFAGSLAIIAWLVMRGVAVGAVLVAAGYFVAMNVSRGEGSNPMEQNTFFLNIGLFIGIIAIVVMLGFLAGGWPAIIGGALGGVPALRGIYRVHYEIN